MKPLALSYPMHHPSLPPIHPTPPHIPPPRTRSLPTLPATRRSETRCWQGAIRWGWSASRCCCRWDRAGVAGGSVARGGRPCLLFCSCKCIRACWLLPGACARLPIAASLAQVPGSRLPAPRHHHHHPTPADRPHRRGGEGAGHVPGSRGGALPPGAIPAGHVQGAAAGGQGGRVQGREE